MQAQQYLGFVIVSPMNQYSCKVLHLWVVFNESKTDIIQMFEDDIVKMARHYGARKITFLSPRNWERRLKKFGYKLAHHIFEKDI